MSDSFNVVANLHCRIGENPLWNPLDGHLYWLDIPVGTIHRYDPISKAHEVVYQGAVTGGFTLQADGALILFGVAGRITRLFQGEETVIVAGIPGEERNRFNDIIADPAGRVLCGTTPYLPGSPSGSLYLLENDGSLRKLLADVRFSNGMGFSPDQRYFYLADSLDRKITRYQYDPVSGNISDPETFAVLADGTGLADGLTVDAAGYVWLAVWNGSRLIRYTPQGTIEREIAFPVRNVSSLTFAGTDLQDIYVTSAGGEDPAQNGTLAGALFHLRIGIQGKAEYFSRIAQG